MYGLALKYFGLIHIHIFLLRCFSPLSRLLLWTRWHCTMLPWYDVTYLVLLCRYFNKVGCCCCFRICRIRIAIGTKSVSNVAIVATHSLISRSPRRTTNFTALTATTTTLPLDAMAAETSFAPVSPLLPPFPSPPPSGQLKSVTSRCRHEEVRVQRQAVARRVLLLCCL